MRLSIRPFLAFAVSILVPLTITITSRTAFADRIDFSYTGAGKGIAVTAAVGNFTYNGTPSSLTLASLTAFNFAVTLNNGDASTFTYSLADLTSFSATLSGDMLLTLSLQTGSTTGSDDTDLAPESFTVTNLGAGGAGTAFDGFSATTGQVTETGSSSDAPPRAFHPRLVRYRNPRSGWHGAPEVPLPKALTPSFRPQSLHHVLAPSCTTGESLNALVSTRPLLAFAVSILLPLTLTITSRTAFADTIDFSYTGAGKGIAVTAAVGSFTYNGTPSSLTLASLNAFNFAVTLNNGDASTFTYFLADLTSFSATLSGDILLTLSLQTDSTTGSDDTDLAPESFTVTNLGAGGAGTAFDGFSATTGQVTETGSSSDAPVPEPSTLALFGTGILSLVGVARRKFLSRY
jgi:hypothetical protein